MSRPMYESGDDLSRERLVAKRVAEAFGMEAVKLPKSYPMDFALVLNNSVSVLLEVKCRTCSMSQYDTYMLSLAKLAHCQQLGKTGNIGVKLAVAWSCGTIGGIDLMSVSPTISIGGRTDRGDWQDIEPVAHIPISSFTLLPK